MLELIEQLHLGGLLVGLCTFLIIGICHPLVIKGEYYFGEKIKWWFLIAGIIFLVCSVTSDGLVTSALLGVASFSAFWSVKEVKEQVERVRKGWFPANPSRLRKEDSSHSVRNQTADGKSALDPTE